MMRIYAILARCRAHNSHTLGTLALLHTDNTITTGSPSPQYMLPPDLEAELARRKLDRKALRTVIWQIRAYEAERRQAEERQLAMQREADQRESRQQIVDLSQKYTEQLTRVYNLETRSVQLLNLQGRLSMRGVFDCVEEEARDTVPEAVDKNRTELWTLLLSRRPKLRECLSRPDVTGHLHRGRKQPTDAELARFVADVYKTLSEHVHSNKSPDEYQKNEKDRVVIAEDALSKRQCRAMQCLCTEFGFPSKLVLRPDRKDGEGDQRDEGVDASSDGGSDAAA